mmetsp:Transcript_23130/g.37052  ORF Transcript_23130/g.37052 Transcript_23130/m.37052 type:complete len:84 (-) Transcript_23130:68-319(-)
MQREGMQRWHPLSKEVSSVRIWRQCLDLEPEPLRALQLVLFVVGCLQEAVPLCISTETFNLESEPPYENNTYEHREQMLQQPN